jgi:hypothetical protein
MAASSSESARNVKLRFSQQVNRTAAQCKFSRSASCEDVIPARSLDAVAITDSSPKAENGTIWPNAWNQLRFKAFEVTEADCGVRVCARECCKVQAWEHSFEHVLQV